MTRKQTVGHMMRKRICHICNGKKQVEGALCRACKGTGKLDSHPWSKCRLDSFRDQAFQYVLEDLTAHPPKYDHRSEIGRWMNAIYFEFAELLKTGKVTGKRFYCTEEQTREYVAALGPSPLALAMGKIFNEFAGTTTPMGKTLEAVFPHQTSKAIAAKKKRKRGKDT